MNKLKAAARRFNPLRYSDPLGPGTTLRDFVWKASGVHQLYVGLVAIGVTLLNFVPIELQRCIVDDAVINRNMRELVILAGFYLITLLAHAGLKYVLMVYQGWVGESAVKTARDQLAVVASRRVGQRNAAGGQTANIIGNEIDSVGGFVGMSISDFVVSASMMIVVFGYMVYVQPIIAAFSAAALVPQFVLARHLQHRLNDIVEHQVLLVRRLGDEAVDSASTAAKVLHKTGRTIPAIFRNRMELYLLKFGLKTLLSIATASGSLAVLAVGSYLVINGQTTIGTVVAFISGFQRLSDPVGDLLDFYRTYSQTRVQHRMIVEWMVDEPAK